MASLPMNLTIASVKSRPLSWTWTFPTSPLMPRPKLQPSPSTPKEPKSFLLMKPTPTLKLKGMLPLLTMKNLLGTVPVNLKGTRKLRRMKNLPTASSIFFFFFFCVYHLLFTLGKHNLFLPSPVVLGFFGCKHLLAIGFLSVVSCFVYCSNILCIYLFAIGFIC